MSEISLIEEFEHLPKSGRKPHPVYVDRLNDLILEIRAAIEANKPVYTNVLNDLPMPEDVGGIEAGTLASELNGLPVNSVLDDLLFPTVLAEVQSNKSIDMSITNGVGEIEAGNTLNLTLNATFNEGVILDGNKVDTHPLVGPATLYTFTGSGIAPTAQVGNSLAFAYQVQKGQNTWAVQVDHAAETEAYFSNKLVQGTNLDVLRGASNISGNFSAIVGRYNYFHGIVAGATPSDSATVRALPNNLFSSASGFTTTVFSETKYTIAVPDTKTITSIITSNNENITAQFTDNEQLFTVNDAGGNPVNYKIYTFTSVVPLGVTATVSITGL